MGVEKGYHCAYSIHYHIVFPVKYRKALLDNEVEDVITATATGIADRYGITIERMGCDRDHIHLLCGAHLKYSPGDIVRVFKSITARMIFKELPRIKQDLWGGEFWTDGYYVGTIGEHGDWQTVENYVRNQGYQPDEVQLRLFNI